MLRLLTLLIILSFSTSNSFSEEFTEDYIKLMIKKGIVTKKLCLKQTAKGVDIILKGQAYKLGYYIANEELENFANLPTDQLANKCLRQSEYKGLTNLLTKEKKGIASVAQEIIRAKQIAYKSFISQNESDLFPKKEFNKLAEFLRNYHLRATDVKELTLKGNEEPEEVFPTSSITIKATGFADGVRNTTEDYDRFIANNLCSDSRSEISYTSKLRSKEEPLPLSSYFDKTIDPSLKGSNNHLNSFLTSWNAYTGKAKDASPGTKEVKLLSRYRNTFLAKMRADSLANKAYDSLDSWWKSDNSTIPRDALLIKNSEAEISDEELNPETEYMCKGFCNMRRGAKLTIDFPFSEAKDDNTSFFNSISTHFESPTAIDQLRMNKFAMRYLVNDFNLFLNQNKNDKYVKKEFQFLETNIKKTPKEPNTYKVIPLFADFGCPSDGGTCDDITYKVKDFNKNSLLPFLQTFTSIMRNDYRANDAAAVRTLIAHSQTGSFPYNLFNDAFLFPNIYRKLAKSDCSNGMMNLETVDNDFDAHTESALDQELKTVCKTMKRLAAPLDASIYDWYMKRGSRAHLNYQFDVNKINTHLLLLLGSDKEYLEDFLKNYSAHIPKNLQGLITHHLNGSILSTYSQAIKAADEQLLSITKEFLKKKKLSSANFKKVLNIKKIASINKSSTESHIIKTIFKTEAPLIEYYKSLFCTSYYIKKESCPFYKNSEVNSDYILTKYNHPSLDFNQDSSNVNFLQHLAGIRISNSVSKIDSFDLSNSNIFLTKWLVDYDTDQANNTGKLRKSFLNTFYEGALLFSKEHFETPLSLDNGNVFANYLQDRFKIPDQLNMHYYDEDKKVSLTKDFREHFRPLIDWTQNIIHHSISSSTIKKDGSEYKFKPKPLGLLNYNSEHSASKFGTGFVYPLYLANKDNYESDDKINSINQFLFKNFYKNVISIFYASRMREDFTSLEISNIAGLETEDLEKDNVKAAIKKSSTSRYGFINESQYNSDFVALHNLLKLTFLDLKISKDETEAEVESKKYLVPFQSISGQKNNFKNFVGSNLKAITFIASQRPSKKLMVEDIRSEDSMYKAFKGAINTSGFTASTQKILEILEFANAVMLRDSQIWYNAFDPIGQRWSDPYRERFGKPLENLSGERIIETLDHYQISQMAGAGPLPSVNSAQVSTIFSFANYSDALADILNDLHKHSSRYNWHGKKRYRQIYRAVPPNLKYIFFKPKNITGAEPDKQGEHVSGWVHTACKTGTAFPYLPNKTTQFHYQSRYRSQRNFDMVMKSYYNDYPSPQKYRHPYDNTFFIPTDESTSFKPHHLISMKRPTSYMIPNCNKCGCLKNKFNSGKDLEVLLATALKLNFTDHYKWISFNSKYPYAEKRFDVNSSLKDNREVGSIYSVNAKKDSLNGKSENYCLYSPLVPQSHEVGAGSSKVSDSLFEDIFDLELSNTDFLMDALNGTEFAAGESYLDPAIAYYTEKLAEYKNTLSDDKLIADSGYSEKQLKHQKTFYAAEEKRLTALKDTKKYKKQQITGMDDLGLTNDQVDSIYNECTSYLNNFPMSPQICKDQSLVVKPQTKENYNWCSSLPKQLVESLGSRCYSTADTIFRSTSGKVDWGSDNANVDACNALSKTYDDDGNIIKYNQSTKKIELVSPEVLK